LAEATEGMTGSDLKELCRSAAMQPVREFARSHQNLGEVKREEVFLFSFVS
jgi:SpoVK/Ycf46/Vps4 family AAA+-type ATPase